MGKRSREKQERRIQQNNQLREENLSGRSKLENFYFSIIQFGTYLALFTPFIFIKDYFFPFVVPKTIFFRIIVDIIFIAYILLVISNPRYRPRFNAFTITITVFLGIVILTSLTGVNLARSFWSVSERMTGLLTFFHLYAFFIILSSVFQERKYWERILTVSIFVGILICFYLWTSEVGVSRGGATLGNTSFMSAYLLFDILFALIFFLSKNGWWKFFYGLTLIPLLIALFFNKEPTRGAIGALFIGLIFFVFGYLLFSKNKLLKRLAPIFLVSVILIITFASQTTFFKEKIIDIKNVPGRAREIVWQMGFEGWQERFWFGWGQENFNIPFAKYFNPELPLTLDVWYDRVHNVVLDTAVTSGILGLLSYLAIFGVAIFGLLRVSAKVAEKKNVFLPLGMVALLIIYFIQNIWVFDMISSYMIFFLSLAFINFLIGVGRPEIAEEKGTKINRTLPLFGALLIIIVILTLYFGNIQSARTSQYIVQGIILPLEKAIPTFQKAIKTSPISIFEAPEQFSKKITGYTFDPNQNREILEKGFELAAKELKRSIEKNPQDYRLYLVLGKHYNDFFLFIQDQEKLKEAEIYLNKAIELSPNNQQTYWSLAQTRLSQGREEESFELLKKAIDLEPRYSQSYWYLAMAYKIAGKNAEALEKVKDAEKTGFNWKSSLDNLKKVIEIYQSLQDDKSLVELYPLTIQMDPKNAQFYAAWAVASANLGDFQKARELAQEALKLNPDFSSDLEKFLESLPQ